MTREGPEDLTPAAAKLRALAKHGRDLAGRLRAREDPYDQIILAALLSRATSTTEAIASLAADGFGQQALILNRVLYELMVDAHWAHANPATARERFLQHARFKVHLQCQAIKRYPERFPGVDGAEGLSDDEAAGLKKIFGTYGHVSWTGLSLRRRVEAIEDQFPEGEQRRNLWFFQDVVNDASNAEVHPSPWSLGRIVRRVPQPDGTEMIQVRIEPEFELGLDAVQRAWWCYGELLDVIVREFDLPRDELDRLARDP